MNFFLLFLWWIPKPFLTYRPSQFFFKSPQNWEDVTYYLTRFRNLVSPQYRFCFEVIVGNMQPNHISNLRRSYLKLAAFISQTCGVHISKWKPTSFEASFSLSKAKNSLLVKLSLEDWRKTGKTPHNLGPMRNHVKRRSSKKWI